MSADAGWYADPADPAWVRWWDGASWSAEAHPAAGIPQTAAAVAVAVAPIAVTIPTLEPLAPVVVESRQPVGAGVGGGVGGGFSGSIPLLEPLAPVMPTASVTTPVVTAAVAVAAPAPADPGLAPERVAPAPTHGRPPIDIPSAVPASAPWEAAAPVRPGGSGSVGGARFGGVSVGAAPVTRSGASAPMPVSRPATGGGGAFAKHLVVFLVVLALLTAGIVLGVMPKLREKQALETAAQTPSVLPRSAPRALAGQKAMAVPGLSPGASASAATSQGSQWAWAASYGKGTEHTIYLAADVPADTRADAVRAQNDPAAAARLISTVTSRLSINPAAISNGAPSREYGASVGGKAWCMPVTLNGNGGGWCVWTNGKDLLQVLSFPSVQEMSAQHTLAALNQLAEQAVAVAAKPAKK